MTDTPDPVDVHVGSRIRERRRVLGLSQEKLADALGLTFQQVQKYERGANRVSGSKLYATARFLGCEVGDFFPPIQPTEADHRAAEGEGDYRTMLLDRAGDRVIRSFIALTDNGRRALAEIAVKLTGVPELQRAPIPDCDDPSRPAVAFTTAPAYAPGAAT